MVHDAPTVDVLITCCSEDPDVILDTVRAACVLDYPPDRYRVLLCDDGSSEELRRSVNDLSSVYPHLVYTSRTKGPVRDYKAGNLNHGLRYSRMVTRTARGGCPQEQQGTAHTTSGSSSSSVTLPYKSHVRVSQLTAVTGTSDRTEQNHFVQSGNEDSLPPRLWAIDLDECEELSEFIAGLDADMICDPQLLRALLPHMVDDPKMAMACLPQVRLQSSCCRETSLSVMSFPANA